MGARQEERQASPKSTAQSLPFFCRWLVILFRISLEWKLLLLNKIAPMGSYRRPSANHLPHEQRANADSKQVMDA